METGHVSVRKRPQSDCGVAEQSRVERERAGARQFRMRTARQQPREGTVQNAES